MITEKRVHPRVLCDLEVACEFVDWKDNYLAGMIKPFMTRAYDISEAGICIAVGSELTDGLVKHLLDGTKKMRIGIRLPQIAEPVVIFSRVAWHFSGDKIKLDRSHCGCAFISPPEIKVWHIHHYVKEQIQSIPAPI